MAVEIVRFAPEHLSQLEPPVNAPEGFEVGEMGPGFTLCIEGRPMACGGVVLRGSHGIVWSHLSDEIRRHPMILHRRVRRSLQQLAQQHGLTSLEASARSDVPAAKRWLRRLGFEETDEVNISGHTYTRFVR